MYIVSLIAFKSVIPTWQHLPRLGLLIYDGITLITTKIGHLKIKNLTGFFRHSYYGATLTFKLLGKVLVKFLPVYGVTGF